MIVDLPPQPQVAVVVTKDGQTYEFVGHLAFEEDVAYAIPATSIEGRWAIQLDKERLERGHGPGLPYFVHRGEPIQL